MEIFKLSMKRILKNKIRLLILLIMPLIFIALFALQNERSITVGIADNDKSALSQRLVKGLENIYKIKLVSLKETEVFDKAVSYQNEYAIIIEKGFEEKIMKGKKPEVKEFYLNEKEKFFYIRALVDNYINDLRIMAAGVNYDKARFETELKNYDASKLGIKNTTESGSNIPQTRAAMGFLIQFMLYMSVITAGILIEDKNNGVFYRTFYAPVTLKRYLGENLAAFMTVGIAQVIVILGLVQTVFKLDFGIRPINLYIIMSVFALVCISLGMWLVSIFKKPLGAYAAIMLLTTPLVMLGGCYWPLSYMPELFQKAARFIPTTWAIDGVEKILYEGKGITGISLQILVLLIFSGIFMAAGIVKKVDISR